MREWSEVYEFWFGTPGSDVHGKVREFWFGGGPEIDEEIRDRFSGLYNRAVGGELNDWKADARGCTALIVVLDQFPRNIYRGDARAFAHDDLALETARMLVDGPHHASLVTVEKLFAYLPFEHSERIEDQERCLELYRSIDDHDMKSEWIDFAVEHRDIIAEFGRFPHRNDILGRESTAAEKAWLASSDQRFGTAPETGSE